jgi:hypothetical protein
MAYRNGPKIITDGLVLCLDAAISKSYSGSGSTWYDLSGNGNNCTLFNSPVFLNDNRGCLDFDGSNDYGSVTRNSSLSPISGLTEEVFINLDTNVAVYIGLQYGTSSENSYALWYDGNSWNGLIRNSSGMQIIQYDIVPSTNIWYHLVHTYDGSNQKIYVNGDLKNTITTTGSITYDAGNTEITINADNNGSGYNTGKAGFLNGSMSMARIYNRGLLANEVRQNFNATRGRFGV